MEQAQRMTVRLGAETAVIEISRRERMRIAEYVRRASEPEKRTRRDPADRPFQTGSGTELRSHIEEPLRVTCRILRAPRDRRTPDSAPSSPRQVLLDGSSLRNLPETLRRPEPQVAPELEWTFSG